MVRYRNWVLVAVTAACGVGGLAQESDQRGPPPATQDVPGLNRRQSEVPLLKTESRLVVLDVIVTDAKGKPVQGLKQSDFVLREDGMAQTLTGFEEHTMADARESAKRMADVKLPPNTFSDDAPPIQESSYVLLVLDALNTGTVEQMRERQEMLAYAKTVPAGTRIAMVQLDTSLHLVQGFSSDPGVLLDAVQSKRDYPELPPPVTIERYREIMTQAVKRLSSYLAGYPGRKSVIWFGSGAGATGLGVRSMFADNMSFLDEMRRTTDVLTLNQIAVYVVQPGVGGSMLAGMQTQVGTPNVQMSTGELNQINRIAAAGGTTDLAQAATQQRLKQSGGDLIYNTNGVKEAIQQIAQGAWSYYTLSYSPTNKVFDSAIRRLRVDVPGRELDLQYRRSYYALNDDAKRREHVLAQQTPVPVPPIGQSSAKMTSIDAAMLLGAPTPRDVLFTAHIDPAKSVAKVSDKAPLPEYTFLAASYRKRPYREYSIRYKVNPDSLEPMSSDGVYRVRLDFVAVVYDNLGNQVNSLVERTSADMTAQYYKKLLRDGIVLTQTIAVPAKIDPANGSFFLRLGVQDVLRDKAGALEVPIDEVKLGLPLETRMR
jgi:VWFA-related protein